MIIFIIIVFFFFFCQKHAKSLSLTGNLHFCAALHYSTHSVSHNAAVVASMQSV